MKNAKGKAIDGHSVRPFLIDPESRNWDGPDCAIPIIFAEEESKTGLNKADLKNPAKQHWSIRTEKWRYIRYNNGDEEFYDHEADPYEWMNLATSPEVASVLKMLRAKIPVPIESAK